MNIDSDPTAFAVEENFEEHETNTGVAGRELLDAQWATLEVEQTPEFDAGDSEHSPRLKFRFKLKEGKQTGRIHFEDLYLSDKMQSFVDGWSVALLGGRPTVRIGNPTSERDTRPIAPDKAAWAKQFAQAVKGKTLVGHIAYRTGRKDKATGRPYEDDNRLDGWHRASEENLAAIKEAGYADKRVVVKKRKTATGREESYLAAKQGGAATAATPAAGAPSVV